MRLTWVENPDDRLFSSSYKYINRRWFKGEDFATLLEGESEKATDVGYLPGLLPASHSFCIGFVMLFTSIWKNGHLNINDTNRILASASGD